MIKNLTVTPHNKRSLWLLIPLTLIVLALSQPTSAISYSSTPGQYPTFSSNNGSSSNTTNTSSSGTTSGFSTSGSSTSTPTFSGTGSSSNETNDESSGTTSGFSTTGSTTSHPTFSASGPSDNETNDDSSGTTNGFSTTGTPFSYPTFSATGPTDNETNTEPTGTTYGFSVPPIINNPPTQTETTNNTTSDTTSIPPHNNNQLGSITFYHNDATNSPIAATDELGHVLWTERREPFGEPKLNDSGKAQHRVGYTGHVYDKELGLHYQGRRFYDPIIGRFTSIDPVGFHSENVQSFNRYAYANNNPYRFYDPDGRVPVLIFLAPAIGNALSITGAAFTGYAVGSNINSVVAGDKSLGQATADAAVEVGVGLAFGAAGKSLSALGKSVTKGGAKSIKDQALDLVPANSNKNRVTLRSDKQQLEIDLTGKDHAGIPTPHTKVSSRNTRAPDHLQPAYNTSEKKSTLRPSTQQDIRAARRYLERQNR